VADFWPEAPDGVPVAQAILAPRYANGLPMFDEMPANRPPEFIVVSQIDGRQVNPKQFRATLLIQFWASSTAVANQMGRTGTRALKNSRGKEFAGVFSYGWGNEYGPSDYDDPKIQDRRRCQLTGDLLLSTEAS
jgi:hypothetical protein